MFQWRRLNKFDKQNLLYWLSQTVTTSQDLQLIPQLKQISKERDFNQVKLPWVNFAVFWKQQLSNTESKKSSLGTGLSIFFFNFCLIHTNATN